MPDYRFIYGASDNKPSSGYAGRIPYEIWSQFEAVIRQMYAQGSTREDILGTLKEQHEFQPSTGQLRDQMTRWGLSSKRKVRRLRLVEKGTTSSSITRSEMSTNNAQINFTAKPHPKLASITDHDFKDQWSLRSSSNLQPKTAEEMEILGNMLFSGRRYAAAFEVFSSLYNQTLESQEFHGQIATCVLLEAIIGCNRSAANTSQRSKASEMAQNRSSWLSETDFQACNCFDEHFARNIGARYKATNTLRPGSHIRPLGPVLSEFSKGHPVTDWELGFEWTGVLQWYYDLLNTSDFHHLYEQEMAWYKDKSAILVQSASESTIYWYLTCTIAGCPPRLSVHTSSAPATMLSSHETIAFVAALLSNDPLRLNCNRYSPSVFKMWLQTLISKSDVSLQTAFHNWKRNVLDVNPDVVTFDDEPNLDVRHIVQELPYDRMPELDSLMALAARTRLAQKWVPGNEDRHPTYTNVFDSEPKIWDNADNPCQKCRNQSSQEDSLSSGCEDVQSRPIAVSYSRKLDPPLNSSPHASNCSSYRSFHSTHLRSRRSGGTPRNSTSNSPNAKLGQNSHLTSKPSSLSRSQSNDPTISPPLRASDHKSYQIFQSTYLRTISKRSFESDNDVPMTDFCQSPSFHLPLSDIDEILVI